MTTLETSGMLEAAFVSVGLREGVSVGVLASGGLDSAVLIEHLARRRRVIPIYVECGLTWEAAELASIERSLRRLPATHVDPIVRLAMPLCDLYGDHWSVTGLGVPDAVSPDEAVLLPGRNPLLAIKPMIWCGARGISHLALGTLAANPFADATEDFLRSFSAAVAMAMATEVSLVAPFRSLTKADLVRAATPGTITASCSCIAPVAGDDGPIHCGRCNKCEERQRAFREAGVHDLTEYASLPGPLAAGPPPTGEVSP